MTSPFLATLSPASSGVTNAPAIACKASTFHSLTLPNIEVLALDVVENTTVTSESSAGGKFCQVTVQYTHPGQNDAVNTIIGLPLLATDWNERFQMVGGGGWGTGYTASLITAVAGGYSSVATDGGHDNDAPVADWGFVSEGNINWPLLWNFAVVTLDEGASLGKLATELYYGTPAKYSAPAINWQRFIVQEYWGPLMANLLDTRPPTCVLEAFTEAAIKACDGLDGVEDGVIALPDQCDFDADSLIDSTVSCTEPSGSIVVTAKHAELVNAVWKGPSSVEGKFEWYGMAKEAPLTGLLNTTCDSVDNCTLVPFPIPEDWLKVFVAKNTSLDLSGLSREDYDRLYRASVAQYASVIGTDNPDLTDLKNAGTKLLTWHGLADQLITYHGTVDYYDRVTQLNSNVTDYYRLFLAPGVEHCGLGPGLDPHLTVFDSLRAWVENGTAPDTILATGPAVGDKNATREVGLCLYPRQLTFVGSDPNDAASFECL
ncbi:tannase and feruloyl esterase-domain-containing protein [Diaporthe sp. PMI_573]|nr:tannase and feruloyl esterase-domain-containing protein [Diaporthaceae sp. PMI_573]